MSRVSGQPVASVDYSMGRYKYTIWSIVCEASRHPVSHPGYLGYLGHLAHLGQSGRSGHLGHLGHSVNIDYFNITTYGWTKNIRTTRSASQTNQLEKLQAARAA